MFFLSGAAGLIYEVVWARQLVLVFGNTTQAVSAILTGYFGGMAVGALIGGRIADRVRRPLVFYGMLELILVAVVLVTPTLFREIHEIYRAGYSQLENRPGLLSLVRYGLALLALAPATVLMGATLPTLSRHLSRRRSELGQTFGRLYAANTGGAVAGTWLAGIVLIELIGLTRTMIVGAVASGVAGVAAILLDRVDRAAPETTAPDPATDEHVQGPPPGLRQTSLVVAFVSGLTSLGYQVLWTRLLSSGTGNTTYVFTTILLIFLIGITYGAHVAAGRMRSVQSPMALLGAIQVVTAAIVLSGLIVLSRWWPGFGFLPRALIVVLPATLAMGVTLPLLSSIVGTDERGIGRDAGLLLASNTFGAILGTFAVPFVLIPSIGSLRSIIVLAMVNVVLGVGLLAVSLERRSAMRRALTVAGAVLGILAAISLLTRTPLTRDPGATALTRESVLLGDAEDEIAAVQAGGVGAGRRLLVNGTGMTVLTVDAKLMSYLPIIARPASQRMLVICFGMGSSFRAGLRAGLQVDGVELVPSVPKMFHHFYTDAGSVLADPRGRLIITDGRNYVELSDRRYDLIVVDPPPPIESSGTSVLYSREFYAASSKRLNAGGVMMEWIPYELSLDELRSHVRTFADVFPNVLMAFGPGKFGVFMLGSDSTIAFEPDRVRAILSRPRVLEDLASAPDAPRATLDEWVKIISGLRWIEGAQISTFAGQASPIRDDHPVVEYFLLRRSLEPGSPRVSEEVLRAATPR
jgi:spermidine synthase